MKPMSPTRLANKKISLSPWTNRNLYLNDLSTKSIYSRSHQKYGNVYIIDSDKINDNNISDEKLQLERRYNERYARVVVNENGQYIGLEKRVEMVNIDRNKACGNGSVGYKKD